MNLNHRTKAIRGMSATIVDIDGICFDPSDRLNRCRNEDNSIDWNRAFSNIEVIQDPTVPNAAAKLLLVIKLWPGGITPIYLTSRSRSCEEATLSALDTHNFVQCQRRNLLMREWGDLRSDAVIKAEYLDKLRDENLYYIWFAIDDDYSGTLAHVYAYRGITHYLSLDECIRKLDEDKIRATGH